MVGRSRRSGLVSLVWSRRSGLVLSHAALRSRVPSSATSAGSGHTAHRRGDLRPLQPSGAASSQSFRRRRLHVRSSPLYSTCGSSSRRVLGRTLPPLRDGVYSHRRRFPHHPVADQMASSLNPYLASAPLLPLCCSLGGEKLRVCTVRQLAQGHELWPGGTLPTGVTGRIRPGPPPTRFDRKGARDPELSRSDGQPAVHPDTAIQTTPW